MPDDALPVMAGAKARPAKTGRWRPTVTFALAFSTCGLILLSMAVVIFVQISVSRKNTFELLREISGLLIQYMDTSVQSHLTPARDQAEFVGRRIESGEFDLTERERLGVLLTGALAGTPQISAILTWDLELQQFGIGRNPEGGSLVIARDQSSDPLMIEALRDLESKEGAFWGELVFRDGATRINLRRPLRRHGRLIGMLVVAIDVAELSRLAAELGDVLDATAFVLYGRDNILAHPNLTSRYPEQSPESPLVGLDRVGDLVLSEIWSGRPAQGLDASDYDAEITTFPVAEEWYYAIYREVTAFGETPWYVGAWFKVEENNVIDRLVDSLVFSLVLLLFALVAAVLLGRLIARPIRRLAEGTSRIGHLELEQVDSLAPSRLKELDDQARAFNAMLASLRAFETYVPRSLVMRLIRGGERQKVASEERSLAVLFTDIVGFAKLSEGVPAAEVAAFLNDHFGLLGACVEAEAGTVDKFIGDAIMAFWGAPDPQPDTAARACRAALAMARAVEADNRARTALGKPAIRLRIGIHSGPVVVGNIGWPGRINYTIVGDTVNSAQRLEVLGKELDRGEAVTILVSGAAAAQLSDDFALEPAGTFEIKGKSEKLEVFRLLAGPEAP